MATVAAVGQGSSSGKANDEVQMTFEDQQRINSFARRNSRYNELKADVDKLKKRIQALEDAGDEMMLLEGESDVVPYHIGEVFFLIGMEEAESLLEQQKNETRERLGKLEKTGEDLKKQLAELKVELYGKFGNNINLEEDED